MKKYLFKPDYSDPDSDDYKKAVTVNNILKIMQRVLPKNRKLYFKNRDGNLNTYIVNSDVTLNETYRDLQRITGSTLEIHLDVKLFSFVQSESIKFTINFKGDLNRKRVEYKPGEMMLNPYSGFTEILFTNKYKITEQILNRDVFKSRYGDKMDKRLFFLDKTIHTALLDYLKNEELEKRRRQGKSSYKGYEQLSERQKADQHKANVDLVIKYFFEQSTDKKYPRKGAIVLDKKNYYIQRISNRDYFFGNEPRSYETMQIPVQEATIDLDYETFQKFYNRTKKESLRVYVDKSPEELIRLDLDYQNRPDVQKLPAAELEKIKSMHNVLVKALKDKQIKPRFQQVFTTFIERTGLKDFDKKNQVTSTVYLNAVLDDGTYIEEFKNIPYSAIKIIVDRENIEALLTITTIDHIYRGNKRFEFIDDYASKSKDKFLSSIDAGVILVKDKGAQQLKSITSGESEKTVYGVELDLTVLDRGAGNITFARELLSGSCIDNSTKLDETIKQVFKPIFGKESFQFFQNIIVSKGRQQREKYRDYVEEKYADQIRLKPKDKDGKDGKDKDGKDGKDEKNGSATSVKKGGSKNRNRNKTKKLIKYKKYLKRKYLKPNKRRVSKIDLSRRHNLKPNTTIKRNRLFKRKQETYKKK